MFAMQMFDILSFIVPIMFIVVFGIIIFSIIQGISTWHKNNNSPRLTVPAVIVAKRTDVSYHRHANAGDMSGAHGFHTQRRARPIMSRFRWKAGTGWSSMFPARNTACSQRATPAD